MRARSSSGLTAANILPWALAVSPITLPTAISGTKGRVDATRSAQTATPSSSTAIAASSSVLSTSDSR